MEEVNKDIERVAKKQRVSAAKAVETVDSLLAEVQRVQAALAAAQEPAQRAAAYREFQQRVAGLSGAVAATAAAGKELNAVVAKLGKSVEKHFNVAVEKAWWDRPMDAEALSQVLVQHLLRSGHFTVAERVAADLGVPVDAALKESFTQMHTLVQQLRAFDAEPVLRWASEHRQRVSQHEMPSASALEFRLHQLQFLALLQQGGRAAAVQYARKAFPTFAGLPKQMVEVQRLMGCLLYAGRLSESPYVDLVSDRHWDTVADDFIREFCGSIGQPSESPLALCVRAGVKALPTLLKLATVMSAKGQSWDDMQQLPVEIELGREFTFQSIFACPVARDQSTPDNPPMILPCGLVLCRNSISKLAKGNSRSFKCPYCPIETNINQCRPIFF